MKRVVVYVSIVIAAVVATSAFNGLAAKAEDENPLKPKAILETYELMDVIVNPAFEELRAVAVKEPEGRSDWKGLYNGSHTIAELMNLVFSRSEEDYVGNPDWAVMTAQTRLLAEKMGAAIKEQDYPTAKEHYLAMVQSCNACHVKFIGEDEVVIEAYPPEE